MSNIFGTIKFKQNNHNKKKMPYIKLEGDYDILQLKMGVDNDELEKMIRCKKIKR